MKLRNKKNNHTRPLLACSLPILLTVAACGSGLDDVENALSNGEEAQITVSNNDDGDLVISTNVPSDDGIADTPAVLEARALLAGLAVMAAHHLMLPIHLYTCLLYTSPSPRDRG